MILRSHLSLSGFFKAASILGRREGGGMALRRDDEGYLQGFCVCFTRLLLLMIAAMRGIPADCGLLR